ncbi:hypothetical protein RB614_23985 [Phytohabitans sp. ZYX-F-186]|uniref:Haem-binding uptake Tiki superfamily ChaN domain-containing protein n=1 Tax=Phytohabitans maris TaxID=3071409 RepID=A0ABU0ZKN2_9ACTN|nr:hypothetical protein [Phytohabitans sp. ZYX-F-186]MDQ7907585.1 hypothetical protein [Phytohabitans sp. ZYX-F-186]
MPPGVRIRRRQLQTAVRHFRHRRDGRRITLVATIHCALPVYFTELKHLICQIEQTGAAVYCEGLDRFVGPPEPDPTPAEQQILDRWNQQDADNADRRAQRHGYVTQRHLLDHPSWRNVDLPARGMVRLVGLDDMRQWLDDHRTAAAEDPHAELASQVSDLTFWREMASRRRRIQRRVAAREHPRLYARRRQIILERLHAQAVDQDIVAVNGCGHHWAMCADLRAHGYRQTGVSWHTARPFPSFLEQIRLLQQLNVARQSQADRPITNPATASTAGQSEGSA